MSNFVYKNKDVLIILKPSGVSSQPDNTAFDDALTRASGMLSEGGEPSALFPVHRLDKVVGGLLVFARNRETAAELSRQMPEGEFSKEYLAVTEGNPSGGMLQDYLVKNATLGKAIICEKETPKAKLAELEYLPLETVRTEKGDRTLVKISLKTGRFHQIRAQFSGRGYPLLGDKKYGSKDHRAKTPALFAYKLGFSLKGNTVIEKALPNLTEYPWNLFGKETYQEV